MDFLKKHGFAVGLGALGLGAMLLLWFMVVSKIWGFAEHRESLGTLEKKFKKYASAKDTPILPNENTKNYWTDLQKKRDDSVAEGLQFYDAKKEQFDDLQPSYTSTVEDATGYKPFYNTEIDRLRKDYQAAFAPAAPVEEKAAEGAAPAAPAPAAAKDAAKDPKDLLPVISQVTKFNDAADVKRAAKELWIITEIITKLKDIKIGGLQDIGFPEREKSMMPDPTAPKDHRWFRARAVIEMPFIQVEPFLAQLLGSDRVPLRLESLEIRRKQETVLVKAATTKSYANKSGADADDIQNVPPEPPVLALFELSALTWIGPQAAPAESAPVEDEGDKPAGKKTGSGGKKKVEK